MKSILIRTVAASALVASFGAGALAQDSGSGFVSARYSNSNIDTGGGDVDVDGWGLGGAYANDLSGMWDLQLNLDYDNFDASPDVDLFSGDAHVTYRNNGAYAVGGFLSFADSDSSTLWGGGGEVASYGPGYTLGAQAGWFSGDDAIDSVYGACGFARGYVNDDFAFEGRAALGQVDFGVTDTSAYSIGAGAAYRFSGTGFEINGGVDYADLDDFDVNSTTFTIGGTYHFGTATTKEKDQDGAGLRGSSCLLGFARF